MDASGPDVANYASNGVELAKDAVDMLELLFSTLFLSAINIVISGQILGEIFSLPTSGDDYFTLRVPSVMSLKVSGKATRAGFTAFAVSLLIVGVWLPEQATQIFSVNLRATESRWTAALSLAAALSLVSCLFIAGARALFLILRGAFVTRAHKPEPTPDERVKMLVRN